MTHSVYVVPCPCGVTHYPETAAPILCQCGRRIEIEWSAKGEETK